MFQKILQGGVGGEQTAESGTLTPTDQGTYTIKFNKLKYEVGDNIYCWFALSTTDIRVSIVGEDGKIYRDNTSHYIVSVNSDGFVYTYNTRLYTVYWHLVKKSTLLN